MDGDGDGTLASGTQMMIVQEQNLVGSSLGAAELPVDPISPGVVSCQVLHHCHVDDASISGCPLSEANTLIGCSIGLTLEGRSNANADAEIAHECGNGTGFWVCKSP